MESNITTKPLVTDRLLNALINLMHHQDWSHITVTSLIKEAGVARASFYRNFAAIEDVILYGIDKTVTLFLLESKPYRNHQTDPKYVQFSFDFYKKHAELILAFNRTQFSQSLLDVMNDFIIETYGDMPAHSIERYNLYYYTGAFYNMAITWLEAGCPETTKEMTQAYLRLTGN